MNQDDATDQRGEGTTDRTDPTTPGASSDEERRDVNPRETAEAGDRQAEDRSDPDATPEETWEGDTLAGPGPGS